MGGLALEGLDPGSAAGHVELWEKVVRKLRTGLMPPAGSPKPSDTARDAFVAALESTLDREAARRPERTRPERQARRRGGP